MNYTKEDVALALDLINRASIEVDYKGMHHNAFLVLPHHSSQTHDLLSLCIPSFNSKENIIAILDRNRNPAEFMDYDLANSAAINEKKRLPKLFLFKCFKKTGIEVKEEETNTVFSPKISLRKKK